MDVTLQGITKRIGGELALDAISLTFPDRSFTSLFGVPAAGKSTLLKMIAGLIVPDQGRIMIGEQDVTRTSPMTRNVSYIAQEFALYPHMKVYKNIAYPLKLKKISKKTSQEKVHSVTNLLKISHLLERMPNQLSGGEQQRVAIARGLVKESHIYLFDEPLTNLDYKIREDMRGEFHRFQKELGETIIYATGDPLEALSISDRIVVMKEGRVIEEGNTRSVYEAPTNLYTASIFGHPPANIFQGEITENGHFRCQFFTLPCHFYRTDSTLENHETGIGIQSQGVAVIRPENFKVVTASTPKEVTLTGKVFLTDVIGSENILYVKPGEEDWTIQVLVDRDIRPGLDAPISISVDPDHVLIYSGTDGSLIGKGGA